MAGVHIGIGCAHCGLYGCRWVRRQWALDPAKAALILKKFDQVLESVVLKLMRALTFSYIIDSNPNYIRAQNAVSF